MLTHIIHNLSSVSQFKNTHTHALHRNWLHCYSKCYSFLHLESQRFSLAIWKYILKSLVKARLSWPAQQKNQPLIYNLKKQKKALKTRDIFPLKSAFLCTGPEKGLSHLHWSRWGSPPPVSKTYEILTIDSLMWKAREQSGSISLNCLSLQHQIFIFLLFYMKR